MHAIEERIYLFLMFIYLFILRRGGMAERSGGRESQARSVLSVGLNPMNYEIMTQAEIKRPD